MIDYLHVGKASDLDNKKDRRIYRFFEFLPGFLSWLAILLVLVLSFVAPVLVAVFIIVYDVYWFVRTVYFLLHLRVSYNKLKQNMKIDWIKKLENLPLDNYKIKSVKSWQDLYHFVFLPMVREDYSIVAASIESLLKTNYPKSKMAVIICREERGGKETEDIVKQIQDNYGKHFFQLLSVIHPSGLAGEIIGKGSNTAYAAKFVKENIIDRLGIDYDHILVSNFDIDTVSSPEYFGVLTYTFLTTDKPLRASYQPVPLYVNNIWEAPSFARVVAFTSTFWYTILQEKWETAITFSSHSMPFRALVDVGFWQKNMVNEDSRIFWQCFIKYNGDYKVAPLYYPVSLDANVASTTFQTLKNVYKQQRRWAYGVDNVPYYLFNFMKNKLIPRVKRWQLGFITAEGYFSWSTSSVMLFILGWLPVVVGGPEFNRTVLSFNLPYLTRMIMTFAMVGLVTSAVLSIILLPPRPPKYGKFKYVWMFLQWILFPPITIFLGSLPSLDAQTRLMLGKYMGFWATPKMRK